MKNRLKELKLDIRHDIMDLAVSPVSALYYQVDEKTLKSILDDAVQRALDVISNNFIDELNT